MSHQTFAGLPRLPARYALRREIGRGGMATVYLAEDTKHGRDVAIKVLLPELSAAIGAERFMREIRTVAGLQHPHILPLFDSGEWDGALFFVMPFVEGESLRDLLVRDGPLSLATATALLRQIGDALDHAHLRGVVHRDVKPENILLAGPHALLADFGIARVEAQQGVQTLTSAGSTLGTPAYMSPEQASGEPHVDGRSDLYALGCLAYELLSGAPPLVGANAMATMAQQITRAAPRLVGGRGPVPEVVVDAVARMLEKEPPDRFPSAASFVSVLERALTPDGVGATPSRGARAVAEAPHAVLVLDFINVANALDVDWLSGGIAETMSVDLRKIGGIRVVGGDVPTRQRVAAARKDGSIGADTARSLGASVGARWVVWGAFQKSGPRIRLTPHFCEVESGETFSVEKIDGSIDDIFELQDRIVTALADRLRIELTSLEAEQIARPETVTVGAYELYAKGKQAFLQFGTESVRAASASFRDAIAIDPGYALAWAGLGSLLMPKYIATGDPAVLDEGVRALQRALELDPALGEPYVFLAYMYVQQRRYDEAVECALTAVDRDPGAYMAWYLVGVSLLTRGCETGTLDDLARVIPPLLRSRAINPSFHPAHMAASFLYLLRGQYGHAALLADEAVVRERAGTGHIFLGAYVLRARVHARLHEVSEARALLDPAIAAYPGSDHVYAPTMTAWALCSRAQLAEAAGDDDGAHRDYASVQALAQAHDHRIGIGSHWVNAGLGLARLAHRRGERALSDALLRDSLDVLERRHRFVWLNLVGCTVAESRYELAATHAARGEDALSLVALGEAVRSGWADDAQWRADRNFDRMRTSAEISSLRARATAVSLLPPPSGSGGLPVVSARDARAPSPPVA